MPQRCSEYYRFCPDQPHIFISDAICIGRRRVNFPQCPGCQFNDDVVGADDDPLNDRRDRTDHSGSTPGEIAKAQTGAAPVAAPDETLASREPQSR